MDAIMVLIVAGFFTLTAGLVVLCDRLTEKGPKRD